jgi:hypothetical protein
VLALLLGPLARPAALEQALALAVRLVGLLNASAAPDGQGTRSVTGISLLGRALVA